MVAPRWPLPGSCTSRFVRPGRSLGFALCEHRRSFVDLDPGLFREGRTEPLSPWPQKLPQKKTV